MQLLGFDTGFTTPTTDSERVQTTIERLKSYLAGRSPSLGGGRDSPPSNYTMRVEVCDIVQVEFTEVGALSRIGVLLCQLVLTIRYPTGNCTPRLRILFSVLPPFTT